MSHQNRLLAVLIGASVAVATVVSYSADVLSLSSIEIKGTSTQVTSEYLYFTTSEDTRCGGIRILEDGVRRRIKFIRQGLK